MHAGLKGAGLVIEARWVWGEFKIKLRGHWSSATHGRDWVHFKQQVTESIFFLWESRLQQHTPIRSILEDCVSPSKSDPFHLAQTKLSWGLDQISDGRSHQISTFRSLQQSGTVGLRKWISMSLYLEHVQTPYDAIHHSLTHSDTRGSFELLLNVETQMAPKNKTVSGATLKIAHSGLKEGEVK